MTANPSTPTGDRNRLLPLAIVAIVATHVAGLAAFLTLLAPGLDLNSTALARANHVAGSPWGWRLGWLPWLMAGPALQSFGIALDRQLGRLAGRPGRGWALAGVGFAMLAIVPDWLGQGQMMTTLVTAAQNASQASQIELVRYVQLESKLILMTATCANSGYTVMLLCWLVAVVRAGGGLGKRKLFALVGTLACVLFGVSSTLTWIACSLASVDLGYPGYDLAYILDAIGFPLLIVWFIWAGAILEESREKIEP